MAPLEALLIGAGERGTFGAGAFAQSNPELLKFVAVAEPNTARRERFAAQHRIPSARQYADAHEALDQGRIARLCFVMTLDHEHLGPALQAMELGYHVFLEKPMAESPEKVLRIQEKAEETNLILQVCHPLRYTPFYRKIKEIVSQDLVGRIHSLSMTENVGYWHFAHSYVRGNWRRLDEAGPLILTKCCHDMDLATWLLDKKVVRVASLGGRLHFHERNAPSGAPPRCLEGCPIADTCAFYAPAIYLGNRTTWPVSVISTDPSFEARREALLNGPYGRCVYRSDNDVADHQDVTAQFANGAVFDFTVRSNSMECYRTIRIAGSRGELNGHLERNEIAVRTFSPGLPEEKQQVEIHRPRILEGGHAGGDSGVIRHFLNLVRNGDRDSAMQSLRIAVEGHLLAFAAEEARKTQETVNMPEFRSACGARTRARRHNTSL